MPSSVRRLTGEQIRAARALARIEQTELAARAQLSLETIKRLERVRGPVDANSRTLQAIVTAFAALNVTFDGGEDGGIGVCLIPPEAALHTPCPRTPSPRPEPPADTAQLYRVIYLSRARPEVLGRMKATVDEIVAVAGARNPEMGITGALFVCNGCFLQAIEGAKPAVQLLYGAISSDSRHEDVKTIDARPISTRQFAGWTMCCGLFANDDAALAHEPAVQEGLSAERLTPAAALGLLSIVRDLQASPPRSARRDAGDCPLASDCLDSTCAASAACHACRASDG